MKFFHLRKLLPKDMRIRGEQNHEMRGLGKKKVDSDHVVGMILLLTPSEKLKDSSHFVDSLITITTLY